MANFVQAMAPDEQAPKSENETGLWSQIADWWGSQTPEDKKGYLGGIINVTKGMDDQKALKAANQVNIAKAKWAGFHPSWAPDAEMMPAQNIAGDFLQGMNAGKSHGVKEEFANSLWDALQAKKLEEVTNKQALSKGN